MKTLLRIDSSSLSDEASFSRQLTNKFVDQWKKNNPESKVITRDIVSTQLPIVTEEWIKAVYTPEADQTPIQRDVLALSNKLVAELQEADEYLFGISMYNFGIPAAMKLWIDQIVRAGKTFSFENGAPKGLLPNKKATFIVASGGDYQPGTQFAPMNFVEPYLRAIFGFLGVVDCKFIYVGGTKRLQFGVDRDTILQPALTAIRDQFEVLATSGR
jgi:FMN-dependent NADH-azoreductase